MPIVDKKLEGVYGPLSFAVSNLPDVLTDLHEN
jgi:hypothetical protein